MLRVLRHKRLGFSVAVVLAAMGFVRPAAAQWSDSFETPSTSWWLLLESTGVQLRRTERVFQNARDGEGFEQLDVRSTGKLAIRIAHRVEPMLVIDELKIRLWVKSSRVGATIGARVVLPHSIDAATDDRCSVVVLGDSLDEANRWTELTLENLAARLDEQLPALRKAMGKRVDASQAYIDRIVVEDAIGPGDVRFGVDGLAIDGIAFAEDQPKHQRTKTPTKEKSDARKATVTTKASHHVKSAAGVFEVDGTPAFVRAIECNGEPLEFLKLLGFNTVKLQQPPTAKIDQEAARLNLWLIAPPVFDPQEAAKPQSLTSVIAWDLGDNLGERELDAARRYIDQSRRIAIDSSPAFVASADSHLWEWSRLVDLMCIDPKGVFSTGELSHLGQDVQSAKMKGRPGAPVWAAVHTEPPAALSAQLDAFRPVGSSKLMLAPEQLRLQAYQAVLGGARGLIFKSRTRLDGKYAEAELRAATLKWTNLQLELIAPFAATGDASILGNVNGETTIGSISADRSTLFILVDSGLHAEFEPSGIFRKSTVVSLSGGGRSPRFQLTWRGVRQLNGAATRDASKVVVERSGGIDYLIQAEDEAAIQFAKETTEQNRREFAATQLQVASLWHAHSIAAVQTVESKGASTLMRASQSLQRGDDFLSLQVSEEAMRQIATARHSRWNQVAARLPSALVSPLCVSVDLTDSNAELATLITNQQWGPNRAIAGGLESVESLKGASWLAFETRDAKFKTQIESSDREPHSGGACLSLKATSATPINDREVATVAITSAGVPVRRGDLVRYRVWARSGEGKSDSRMQLFDNLGGRSMAVTVEATGDWTSIVIYRFATEDSEAALTAALIGTGQVDLDSIEVHTLSLQHRDSLSTADK